MTPTSHTDSAQYSYRDGPVSGFGLSLEDDGAAITMDIRMRLIAEWEDTYWHGQFAREPYYASGRGYDQYQPAYALGWTAALTYPDAEFEDVVRQLELQWEGHRGGSWLPWREVQQAVHAAWEHAGTQMQTMQQQSPSMVQGKEIVHILLPLHSACLALCEDLVQLRAAPMHDFAQQVMDRHIQLLESMAQGLQPLVISGLAYARPLAAWPRRVRRRWLQLKSSWSEWGAERVFAVCEAREKALLLIYQRVMRLSLPHAVRQLLQRQAKQLRQHLERLRWMRHNWEL